jgi:hypothetical protein
MVTFECLRERSDSGPPGASEGSRGGNSGAPDPERDRFCRALTAIDTAGKIVDGTMTAASAGAAGAARSGGGSIDSRLGRLLTGPAKIFTILVEGGRAGHEINTGRDPGAAIAAVGGRLGADALGGLGGGIIGAALGEAVADDPGQVAGAILGAFAGTTILDMLGIRDAAGDLAAGLERGYTPRQCV